MPDFRAAERTFQILTQVAGRAGRGQLPGHVLMQTINPEHYAIRFAAAQDYEGFYQAELKYRRNLHYPPFAAMASMIVRSKKLEEALALSGHLGRHLRDLPEGVFVKGPAAAPVVKLRTEYRYQFLLRARDRKLLSGALQRARAFALDNEWPATALVIDVDPMSLM
jgi:primosomal protein N' (replication factor Y)